MLLSFAFLTSGCAGKAPPKATDEAVWERLCEVRRLATNHLHLQKVDLRECKEAAIEYLHGRWFILYSRPGTPGVFSVCVDTGTGQCQIIPGL